MRCCKRTILSFSFTLALITLSVGTALAQQARGRLRGQITDQLGGLVVGATVTSVELSTGNARTTTSGKDGIYTFADIPPGQYTVRAEASGFAGYENTAVTIVVSSGNVLDIQLTVAGQKVDVTIDSSKTTLTVEDHDRSDTLVLRGQDIEALPDDPAELTAALQALAGPAVGPSGGQILIDGFELGRTPPRGSIREIRLNDNPMAVERDQPSFGSIQIITRPGTEKFHASAYSTFMDESLNARNPFAPHREPFQLRQFGGNISGSIRPKRDSYFIDVERTETDDNDIVNATILDPNTFNPTTFILPVLVPSRNTTFSPRFDRQLNPNNTLVARYAFLHTTSENVGVGGFSLPSRSYGTTRTQHTLQVTETAVLNRTTVNELRFQFLHTRRQLEGDHPAPAVEVQDAFINGGAQIGQTLEDTRFELTNITTTILANNHSIRFGGRLRGVRLKSVFQNNFGGTFIFSGGRAPLILFDSNNLIVRDQNGNPVPGPVTTITSIERYRRTVLLQSQGFTPPQVSALGGGATQFTINGGNPNALVHQFDVSGFAQDEWRLRPNLMITLGLRYENQTNIHSPFNFAPRFFFAWSPDAAGKRQAKTVIRGGFGVFYDRFNEGLTLEARHFGVNGESSFIVTDPAVLSPVVFTLDGVSNVPSLESVADSQRKTTRLVPNDVEAPRSFTAGLLFERQLPHKFVASTGYILSLTRHTLGSVNINAPLPGTFVPALPGSGVFPFGNVGPIYNFESNGTQTVHQWRVGIQNRLLRTFTFSAVYAFLKADNSTSGPFAFPSNFYDMSSEYGRASFEARHSFTLTGTLNLPKLKMTLSPIVIATSGRPFNITTGRDNNGDGLFTDRPAYATVNTQLVDLRKTAFGDFDLNPLPGQAIIARNLGHSPGFFAISLRISRQFKFGSLPHVAAARPPSGGAAPAGTGAPARGPGGGGGTGGGRAPERPYGLTFSVSLQNLFNNTNLASPIGNLSSPFFGQSLSSFSGGFGGTGSAAAGNRRVQVSMRLNF